MRSCVDHFNEMLTNCLVQAECTRWCFKVPPSRSYVSVTFSRRPRGKDTIGTEAILTLTLVK
jgi:hypothetical protein